MIRSIKFVKVQDVQYMEMVATDFETLYRKQHAMQSIMLTRYLPSNVIFSIFFNVHENL